MYILNGLDHPFGQTIQSNFILGRSLLICYELIYSIKMYKARPNAEFPLAQAEM